MTIQPLFSDSEIEFTASEGTAELGYLRLKHSTVRGSYFVDIITVKSTARRRGIASKLLNIASDLLGYIPEPEAILDSGLAFWTKRGFTTGFNQSKLDA